MASSSWFWDKIANHYSKQAVPDVPSYQEKLTITQEYLQADMNVFEFGCGTGSTAIAHAPFVKDILAIDCSENMLDIARSKAAEAKLDNITFEQAEIDSFTAADETYDVVMGHSILHLVKDKDAIIKKAHDLLKPGGIFVTSTACLGDMSFFFKLLAPIFKVIPVMPSIKAFSRAQLEASMMENGFTLERSWLPGKNKAVFIIAKKI